MLLSELPCDVLREIFSRMRCEFSLLGGVSRVNREFHLLAGENDILLAVRTRFWKDQEAHCSSCREPTLGFTGEHLMAASSQGHLRCVHYFISRGIDVDTISATYSPIYAAAESGHVSIVQYLVQRGATYHTPLRDSETPLHVAARHGHVDVVRYLIREGASVDTMDSSLQRPLHSAALNGHVDVVRALVQGGVAPVNSTNGLGQTALYIACEHNQPAVALCLVECGANVDSPDVDGQTPLSAAAFAGHVRIIEYLHSRGASVETALVGDSTCTPLYLAAMRGHLPVVELLLRLGAKAQHDVPDHAEATSSDGAAKYGVSTSQRDVSRERTAVFAAAENGHVSVLACLASAGASLRRRCDRGATPLHAAAYYGKVDAVRFLLDHGVPYDELNSLGWTPMRMAQNGGHDDVVQCLKEAGADH
eukprot:Rmarinus@m.29581